MTRKKPKPAKRKPTAAQIRRREARIAALAHAITVYMLTTYTQEA